MRIIRDSPLLMVNGVISLRCPACTRPFLSLPQQPGALVTCPHCARSATMESYTTAANAQGPTAVSLPIQRRIIPSRPPNAPQGSSVLPSIIRPPNRQPSAWPQAPEQAPQFAPQTHPLFPPAPTASPNWPPVSQIASTPFSLAPPSTAPTQPESPTQPFFTPEPPQPSASPVQASPAPAREYEPWGQATLPESEPPAPAMADSTWQPARDERNVPLGLFLVFVLGLAGWLAWEVSRPPLAIEVEAPTPAPQVISPEPEVQAAPPEPATEKPPEMVTEIRRAELPSPAEVVPEPAQTQSMDLVAATAAAEKLLSTLLESKTIEERITTLSQGEEYRIDVEEFFAKSHPHLKSLKVSPSNPLTLPGQEMVPMLQVWTDKNPTKGALLKMTPQTQGGWLLNWPLFAETHEGRLARFLESSSEQPSWFYVTLHRSHAFDLPEAIRADYLCVDLQASADGSAAAKAVTALDTPLGRYLEREVAWEQMYIARLLLQHRKLSEGVQTIVMLDCEGAVTGAVFPSGAMKK